MTILDLPKLSRRYQPTGQTWSISMHCSHKTFHFLSVSDGPTSILSDIVITLRKSHEIIFVTYFWKTKNTCERCFWDVSETSRKRHLFEICLRRLKDVTQHLFWDVFETSYRRHKKDIFFEMHLRRLKDVTKLTSLLRCFWEVCEISLSMKIWLRSLRYISCRQG